MNTNSLSQAWTAAARFGRWWAGELRGLAPATMRLPSILRAQRADIRPGRKTLEILRFAKDEGERFVEDKPLSAFDQESWTELTALLDGYRARVLLAAPLVHVLTLRLPRAARSHLRPAIPLQLRDHAPLLPELLEWAIVDTRVQDERLIVRVVIVRLSTLDDITTSFLDQGLAAPPILADVGDGRFVHLRHGRRLAGSHASPRPWWIAGILLVSTPLWMLAALHLSVLDQQAKVAAAEEVAQPRLAAEKRLRDKATLAGALKIMLAKPSVTETVDDLAAALPPSAHAVDLSATDTDQLGITLRTSDPDAAGKALAKDPHLNSLHPSGQGNAADGSTQLGFTAVLR